MLTINDIELTEDNLLNNNYNFQPELTKELDKIETIFDQNIINQIVLWKVNRYSAFDNETLNILNQIKKTDTVFDLNITKEILKKLLSTKGVQLAMASTILRFKNPNIYQIIDQRVFRFIYGIEMPKYFSSIEKQIDLYINYLEKLKYVCNDKSINFIFSDRIIYDLDKHYNKDLKIRY
jgi:hypothetical protein